MVPRIYSSLAILLWTFFYGEDMKKLETERLILRTLNLDDLDDFFSYCIKPNIGPNAGWRPHETKTESLAILQMMIKENEVWGIELKENHHLIGTIGLHVRNFENAIANQKEIGYVLDDTYWHQGLMTEAVRKVIAYAFEVEELTKVLCGHATSNLRSKHVIERTGFTYTHTEHRNHFDGTQIEVMMYEIQKEE